MNIHPRPSRIWKVGPGAFTRVAIALVTLESMAIAAQNDLQHAGNVSALLPKATVERSSVTNDLGRQDPVFWKDTVKTLDLGRLRITLDDQSIINVGVRSSMRIIQHDAQTHQTRLELEFGRIRAKVVKSLGPQQTEFEVNTHTGALGSVGTEFYVSADEAETTVIGLEDQVRVRNRDSNIKGEEILAFGEFTTVALGKPPTPKRLATPEELRQAMEGTMPAPVIRLDPFEASPGGEERVTISGEGIDHLPGLKGPDLPVQIEPGPCATTGYVTARLKLSPEVPTGLHEMTFDGPDGPLMAALLVEPKSKRLTSTLERIVHAPQVPAGSIHRGLVVDDAMKPMAGARIRISQNGKDKYAEADSSGMFEVPMGEPGTADLFLEGTDRHSRIQIVKGFDPFEESSRFVRPGETLNVPGIIKSAKVGNQAASVSTTLLKKGQSFSTVELPVNTEDGPGELTLVDEAGNERKQPVFVYRILGGRIDNPRMISGEKTQGEFVVCFGGALSSGQKLNATITGRGFIRFFGDGAQGQIVRKSIIVAGQGTERIPFQVEATKGAGPGVPFFINLSLRE